jgi:ATP-binding cassette subfamily F protein uup
VILVSLERVSKRYAEKVPLDGVTLGIADGDRVGVIGRNGSGKSTLLSIVAGADEPDGGRVVHANDLSVAYLAQDPRLDPDQRVGAMLGSRAAEAMGDRLGIRDLDRRVAQLSGGQRRRLALARTLAEDASLDPVGGDVGLLVLDEPTNHLDVDAVQWLEDLLRSRRGALVLVTHDRYLLDRLATRIVEVSGGDLQAHHGSYEAYLEARVARVAQAEAADQRRRNRLRTELEWLRRAPKARTSKSKLRIAQAQALVEQGPPAAPREVTLDLPSRRLGNRVCELVGVGKRYGDRWVLRGIDHAVVPGARMGVVGPNGAGKTTLLSIIAGRLQPDEGEVRLGATVAVGWYGQDPEPLPRHRRVFDVVDEEARTTTVASGERVSAGGLLERFGFDPEAQRARVGELSGGERRRLELLRVLAHAPNLLLLDEPTNDFDLDTLGVLEEYLDTWPGAFVVATHDRYLLDRVCRDVYSVEPDGGLLHHPGGWAAYAARQEERRRARAAPVRKPPPRSADARPRMLSYQERRELAHLGALLPALESRRAELEGALQDAAADYERALKLGDELTRLLDEIDRAETRWLELSEVEG